MQIFLRILNLSRSLSIGLVILGHASTILIGNNTGDKRYYDLHKHIGKIYKAGREKDKSILKENFVFMKFFVKRMHYNLIILMHPGDVIKETEENRAW